MAQWITRYGTFNMNDAILRYIINPPDCLYTKKS